MSKYFVFQWHITDSCDQRCKHCYIFAGDSSIPLAEMSLGDMRIVFDDCVEMCGSLGRVPYFYITGGDPILHKDFWRLLEWLETQRIAFSIMGNPFHLTDEVCQKLKAHGCERYQLSIDGMKRTHDRLRMSGSFEATVAGISTLNRAGIRSVVMATVSKINIREIPAIIDLVVERAVNVFAFARYCPTGRDRVNHVEPDAYRKLLAICWDRYERYKDSGTAFILKDHLWTLYLHEKGLFAIPDGLEDKVVYDGCNCGISHLTILSNGDVYACRRMDSKVGNVLTNRLGDVWGGAGMERFREYGAFKKCAKCELLRFCRGCPAIAYSITGDFYAADPQCWKEISV